jgi:hypothetical protein
MKWFQCLNCRKLSMLGEAKPQCAACGSVLGEVIDSEALEAAVRRGYTVLRDVLDRSKPEASSRPKEPSK